MSLTAIGDYVEFRVPTAGTLVLEGGRNSSVNAAITATGDFTGGPQSFEMGIGNTQETFQFTAAGVVRYTATNASNGIYFIATNSLFNGATFTVGGEVSVKVTAISPSTPSLTTDGGTWSTGEVVTGPTTDITATYVSADPSVPSMTVSDVVGPWSANTGNYVENTVVNPILIKPETSAITDVDVTSFPEYSWSTGEYNGGPTANTSAPASDAGYTDVGSVDIKKASGIITVAPEINPGLGEIEIYARPSGTVTSLKFADASDNDVLISNLDSVLSDTEWRWISVPGLESIKSIENTTGDTSSDLWDCGI